MTQEVAVGSAAALACYLLFFAVSLLFFRRQPADARDTLRFAAVYGNIGFMGLPLVQSILGEEALVYGALALLEMCIRDRNRGHHETVQRFRHMKFLRK